MKGTKGALLVKEGGRTDGWMNALTGIGDLSQDKRLSGLVAGLRLDPSTLEELYRSDDMAARIVEAIPDEMTRQGWEVCISGDPEASEAATGALAELGIPEQIHSALCWARAFGGAGIVLGVDDGSRDPIEPLNPERVKALSWTTLLAARELIPVGYYADPFARSYGQPQVYQVTPTVGMPAPVIELVRTGVEQEPPAGTQYVHESRVIRFEGVVISRRQQREQFGWGDSVLVRAYEVIRDYQQSWAGAAHLLQDFAQAVVRVKGLVEALSSGDDASVIKRVQLANLSRSIARILLLDSEEEFERKATPLAGVPDMLQQFALRLAAAAGMPVTILMG